VEALLSGLPHDQYLVQCGVVKAIRLVANLPESILEHERHLHDRAIERERADSGSDIPGTSLLNTHWFREWERDLKSTVAALESGPQRPTGVSR
jgi:hypothetical protein